MTPLQYQFSFILCSHFQYFFYYHYFITLGTILHLESKLYKQSALYLLKSHTLKFMKRNWKQCFCQWLSQRRKSTLISLQPVYQEVVIQKLLSFILKQNLRYDEKLFHVNFSYAKAFFLYTKTWINLKQFILNINNG